MVLHTWERWRGIHQKSFEQWVCDLRWTWGEKKDGGSMWRGEEGAWWGRGLEGGGEGGLMGERRGAGQMSDLRPWSQPPVSAQPLFTYSKGRRGVWVRGEGGEKLGRKVWKENVRVGEGDWEEVLKWKKMEDMGGGKWDSERGRRSVVMRGDGTRRLEPTALYLSSHLYIWKRFWGAAQVWIWPIPVPLQKAPLSRMEGSTTLPAHCPLPRLRPIAYCPAKLRACAEGEPSLCPLCH